MGVKGGKQGLFEEDNFTSPGYALRLNYTGVPGLRLSGSFYYCANTGSNADKSQTYDGLGKLPLRIYNFEGQYKNRYVEARASVLWGNLTNSNVVSSKNTKLSNKSPYSRITPVRGRHHQRGRLPRHGQEHRHRLDPDRRRRRQ